MSMCYSKKPLVRSSLIPVVAVLLWIAGAVPVAAYSGIVSIDNVQGEAGQHVAVPIRIANNDSALAAISIPVKTVGTEINIDSVSMVGSVVPSGFSLYTYPTATLDDSVFISLVDFSLTSPPLAIEATEGILVTMYITILPGTQPGVIPLDSFYTVDTVIDTSGDYGNSEEIRQLIASDLSGTVSLYPEFVSGSVTVLVPTAVDDDRPGGLPGAFELAQNYPNPFNPVTTIEFRLPVGGEVRLDVFNVLGQKVETLVDGFRSAGIHQVAFDGGHYPSGIYFYRLSHPSGVQTRKMALVK